VLSRCTRLSLLVLPLLAALIVSGCGGGGGSIGLTSDAAQVSASASATAAPAATHAAKPAADTPTQRVIVLFKTEMDEPRRALAHDHARTVHQDFTLVPAVAADMTKADIDVLKRDARVQDVEPDAIAQATADTVPWGITQVRAPLVWPGGDTGGGVKLAIIDTGLDLTHPDLAPRYAGGYNFVANTTTPQDDNGHGTHVSGIAAATIDGAAVEGVAPAASLYALKVLDATGSGYYSNIIAALQWCVTNKMQIASMSLGGSSSSYALQQACNAAYNSGVLLVAAAGNSGAPRSRRATSTVNYPAAYDSVIAVAATDTSNLRASFSSVGPQVELSAPGVSILSDKLGGGTIIYSGTSMACPHVSGAAALVYAAGVTSAAAVRSRLDSTATDLGTTGRDTSYGYGLLNAYKAVNPTALALR